MGQIFMSFKSIIVSSTVACLLFATVDAINCLLAGQPVYISQSAIERTLGAVVAVAFAMIYSKKLYRVAHIVDASKVDIKVTQAEAGDECHVISVMKEDSK